MSHKIFVYGTLKHGEPNYYVLQTGGQGLNDFGDQKSEFQAAKFVTSAETVIKYPLVIASKVTIIYFFDGSSLSRHKNSFYFILAGSLMEHFLEGIAPLRHWYINPNEKSNKYKSSLVS